MGPRGAGRSAESLVVGLRELTTRDLKAERVHAEDVIDQARNPGMADRLPPPWYGKGVKFTIAWLLGDWTAHLSIQQATGLTGKAAN